MGVGVGINNADNSALITGRYRLGRSEVIGTLVTSFATWLSVLSIKILQLLRD